MRLGTWTVLATGMLVSLVPARVRAQERRLTKADLPAAVQKTVDLVTQGATIRGYSSETEGGQLIYEIETTVQGHSRDVSMTADGTVVEIEEAVALDALPAAVRSGLAKQAGAATITKVEALTKHGTLVAYEAHLRTGDKRSEIQLGPDGHPLAHPE